MYRLSIYQHFREEEYPFIDQVLSQKEAVERFYERKIIDFLDPREQEIMQSIIGINNADIQVGFSGGGVFNERKRAIIAPFYEDITKESFELKLMHATYNSKFIHLSHGDVMGAFLSLGIKRSKLGDIFVQDGFIQIIMTEEISPFVSANLTKIKNANIILEEKPLSAYMENRQQWVETDTTVSSMRIDVIIKEIYRLSRKSATSYIARKLVKVNFKIVDDVKFILREGDMISVRGKGRSKVIRMNGKSKKNKERITTAILK